MQLTFIVVNELDHGIYHLITCTKHNMYEMMVCVRVMVFNATVNNTSVISLRSVLLVEETGVTGENQSLTNFYHIMLNRNDGVQSVQPQQPE